MADDLQSKASELVKKVLTVGVGAIFLTEENLRAMVSEFKLPKELITGVLDSASKSKNEFFAKLSTDVMDRIMERVDVKDLVQELLTKNEIELSVKIRIKPKEPATSDGRPDGEASAEGAT